MDSSESTAHHPIFDTFKRTPPFDDERYHYNFMGARFAHELERDLIEVAPRFGKVAEGLKASGRSAIYDEDPTFPYKKSEDYFEWIDLLTAIDRCHSQFTMIEVGAGYGRWISNAAAALERRRNSTILRKKLVALEANKARFDLMIKNCEQNDIPTSDIELLRMACTPDGSPVLMTCNDDYGAAVFKNDVLMKSCEGESVPMGGNVIEKVPAIRLEELIKEEVDFLDIDIQGAELSVIASCIDVLDRFVKMTHIGTHSPTIDAKLSDMFSLHGWQPRFIFPCGQVNETPYGTFQFIDGIQSWENPRFNWMP